jgi:hypothetical protein
MTTRVRDEPTGAFIYPANDNIGAPRNATANPILARPPPSQGQAIGGREACSSFTAWISASRHCDNVMIGLSVGSVSNATLAKDR